MRISDLTPEMWSLLSPEDQQRYAHKRPAQLKLELPRAEGEKATKLERDEHRTFENWLLLNEYPYSHSRTDKATRQNVGVPDFLVMIGGDHALAIDFKREGAKLSRQQEVWAGKLAKRGGKLHVLRQAEAAIELVKAEGAGVSPAGYFAPKSNDN
jgi:hypothetical protein